MHGKKQRSVRILLWLTVILSAAGISASAGILYSWYLEAGSRQNVSQTMETGTSISQNEENLFSGILDIEILSKPESQQTSSLNALKGTYTFCIDNILDQSFSYLLTFQNVVAKAEPETGLPVYVRLKDQSGNYYLGNAYSYEEASSLNGLRQKGLLNPGAWRSYTLEWIWPYEEAEDFQEEELEALLALEEIQISMQASVSGELVTEVGYDESEDPQNTALQPGGIAGQADNRLLAGGLLLLCTGSVVLFFSYRRVLRDE